MTEKLPSKKEASPVSLTLTDTQIKQLSEDIREAKKIMRDNLKFLRKWAETIDVIVVAAEIKRLINSKGDEKINEEIHNYRRKTSVF